jgi:hypothetical protein
MRGDDPMNVPFGTRRVTLPYLVNVAEPALLDGGQRPRAAFIRLCREPFSVLNATPPPVVPFCTLDC